MIGLLGWLVKGCAILAVISGCVGALLGIAGKITESLMMISIGLGAIGALILIYSR